MLPLIAVGANMYVPGLLEVKGKGIRGVGGIPGKESYIIHTTNIISQRQYFVVHSLISYIGNVFG
jgi:hypothetical protein